MKVKAQKETKKMDTMLRVFAAVGVITVGIFMLGCGSDEEEDSPVPTVEEEQKIIFGLDGDTYRNRRLFKVSNLPVDDWTVKEVNKTIEGEETRDFFGWIPLPFSLYHTTYIHEEDFNIDQMSNEVIALLFMQPTSEADFADTLPKAFENRIPFIYIFIELQSSTDFDSSKRAAVHNLEALTPPFDWEDEMHEVINQAAISSRDGRHGYFWEIVLNTQTPQLINEQPLDIESKAKQSFFLSRLESNRFIYRILFWAPTDQYDTYVSVYDQIVSSIEFRL